MRGDGLFKRRKMWWYSVKLPNGKRERRSTGKREYQEAKDVRARALGDVATSGSSPLLARATFGEGCKLITADYQVRGRRSLGTLTVSLRRLREYEAFGEHRRLAAIGWADGMGYRLWRQGQGMATATINKHIAALKHILHLAVKAGKLDRIPVFDMPNPHNERKGFLEREALERLVRNLPEPYRPLVRCAWLTGWRTKSELLPLTWPQVDFAHGTLRLEPNTTKNGEGRTYMFRELPELAELLAAERREADAHIRATGQRVVYVFHERGKRIPYSRFLIAWHRATAAAELGELIPHDLRRSTVRNLVRASVSEKTAMLLTGHKTRAVFDRYDIVNEADLRAGVAKLAASVTPMSPFSSETQAASAS